MSFGIVSAAYVAAAVLFILSLGGRSGQESAKRAVWYGIAGMGLAVGATVFGPGIGSYAVIAVMLVVGFAGSVLMRGERAQHVRMHVDGADLGH